MSYKMGWDDILLPIFGVKLRSKVLKAAPFLSAINMQMAGGHRK